VQQDEFRSGCIVLARLIIRMDSYLGNQGYLGSLRETKHKGVSLLGNLQSHEQVANPGTDCNLKGELCGGSIPKSLSFEGQVSLDHVIEQ